MADERPKRGILDTSVVIDLDQLEAHVAHRGRRHRTHDGRTRRRPHAATDSNERACRQDRLQRTEAAFDPLPFDAEAARAYGRIYAAVLSVGRKARGTRAVDLMIAAIACSVGLPLYTRNPGDFAALGDLVEIIAI